MKITPTIALLIGTLVGASLLAQSKGKIPTEPGKKISPKDLKGLKAINQPDPSPSPATGTPQQAPSATKVVPPPVAPRPVPQQEASTPPPGADYPALSELEIQATIYAVAGLPEPFTDALLEIPADTVAMEVCDSLAFLGTGHPIRLHYWIRKEGKTELSGDLNFAVGYGPIPIPPDYAGGLLQIQSTRPLIAYKFNIPDRFVFPDRRVLVRSAEVARLDGRRRIRVLNRPNVRLHLLPMDAQQIQSHPQTGPAWKSFLEVATKEDRK